MEEKFKIVCIYCNSDKIIKKSIYEYRGEKFRRFYCKTCNRTFSIKINKDNSLDINDYFNKKLFYELISKLIEEGLNISQIARILKTSRYRIYSWLKRKSQEYKNINNKIAKLISLLF